MLLLKTSKEHKQRADPGERCAGGPIGDPRCGHTHFGRKIENVRGGVRNRGYHLETRSIRTRRSCPTLGEEEILPVRSLCSLFSS